MFLFSVSNCLVLFVALLLVFLSSESVAASRSRRKGGTMSNVVKKTGAAMLIESLPTSHPNVVRHLRRSKKLHPASIARSLVRVAQSRQAESLLDGAASTVMQGGSNSWHEQRPRRGKRKGGHRAVASSSALPLAWAVNAARNLRARLPSTVDQPAASANHLTKQHHRRPTSSTTDSRAASDGGEGGGMLDGLPSAVGSMLDAVKKGVKHLTESPVPAG